MFDYNLGQRIQRLLLAENLENPVDFARVSRWNDPSVVAELEEKFAAFMAELGLTTASETRRKSAQRLVNFYTQELFQGLNYHNFPQINLLANEFAYTEPLFARDILLSSTCEHHLVPIVGKVLIAYRPAEHLLGLNKLNQVVEFFANRPQLQERITRQLMVVLQELLITADVAIVVNAHHSCMASGGLKDHATMHSTYQLDGIFASDSVLRAQVLSYLG